MCFWIGVVPESWLYGSTWITWPDASTDLTMQQPVYDYLKCAISNTHLTSFWKDLNQKFSSSFPNSFCVSFDLVETWHFLSKNQCKKHKTQFTQSQQQTPRHVPVKKTLANHQLRKERTSTYWQGPGKRDEIIPIKRWNGTVCKSFCQLNYHWLTPFSHITWSRLLLLLLLGR